MTVEQGPRIITFHKDQMNIRVDLAAAISAAGRNVAQQEQGTSVGANICAALKRRPSTILT